MFMEGNTPVTRGNVALIAPAVTMRVNKYVMPCRLNFSNLCRTIWIQGENLLVSRNYARIMLK